MPSKSSSLPEGATAPTENLTFYHGGPLRCAPSVSPFALKLETYLRMSEIPYNTECSPKLSAKGKMPYIKHDNKEVADSDFIISYLNEKFEKDLNSSLSDTDKAVSRAFQKMAEENTYWTLVYFRYIESNCILAKQLPLTGIKKKIFHVHYSIQMKPNQKSNLHGQGIGRHSKEEVHEILKKDMHAFSTFLGDKQFFMGDEVTEIDASLFGLFSSFIYTLPDSPHEKFCKETYPNLLAYTERMREKFWPDWEELCFHEKKKEEEAPEQEEKDKENGEKKTEDEAAAGDAKKDPEKEEENKEGKDEKASEEAPKDEKTETQQEEAKPAETNGDANGDSPDK